MKSIVLVARKVYFFLPLIFLCTSCGFYRYTILFKEDETFNNEAFKKATLLAEQAEKNYMVRKFDFVGVEIFTNKGELLTDPNMEIQMGGRQVDITQGGQNQIANQGIAGQQQGGIGAGIANFGTARRYMVQDDGNAYLPLLGATSLEGLKLYQVDSLLSKKYEKYYKDSYVVSRLLNRRVVIIGALGGRIVTLENDNMSIIEAVVSAGFNFDQRIRGDRLRVIRNIQTKPVMQIIDISTYEGLRAANLKVEPNDVIYLEPRRRIGREETLTDFTRTLGTVLSIVSSTVLTILAIRNFK
jgi:polysaccharide biosynthesis/export protein